MTSCIYWNYFFLTWYMLICMSKGLTLGHVIIRFINIHGGRGTLKYEGIRLWTGYDKLMSRHVHRLVMISTWSQY